jgi:hypothetical protein
MIHLDTNTMIALLNETPFRVRERFKAARAAGLRIDL